MRSLTAAYGQVLHIFTHLVVLLSHATRTLVGAVVAVVSRSPYSGYLTR